MQESKLTHLIGDTVQLWIMFPFTIHKELELVLSWHQILK